MGQCSSSSAAVTANQQPHKPKSTQSGIPPPNKNQKTQRPVSPSHDETMSTTHNEADDFAKRAELDQLQTEIQKLEAKAQRYTARRDGDTLQSSWCMMTNSDYSESSLSQYHRTRDEECSWGQMDTSCVAGNDSSCGQLRELTKDAADRVDDNDEDWYGGAGRRQRYSVRSDRASSCSTMDGSLTIHELEQFNGV